MPTKLIRYEDLVQSGIIRNRTQLARLVEHAGFPTGFKLSANARVWEAAEVDAWLAARRARAG